MTEPSELGPEARALLDAARDGMSPDAAAIRRMRARVTATSAGAGVGLALKLVVAVAITAGAGIALHRRGEAPAAPRIELASLPEARVQVAAREAAPSDEELIVLEPNLPREAAEPARAASRDVAAKPVATSARAATVATAKPVAPAAAVVVAATLAREVELLDTAMAALRHGDPGAALHAVQLHAAETAGHGQLAEDAAAIEIEALCHLHAPTTGAKLAAFDARYPRSAQRSRLSSACP